MNSFSKFCVQDKAKSIKRINKRKYKKDKDIFYTDDGSVKFN